MPTAKTEDLARFQEELTSVEGKMRRIFVGACILSVIVFALIVATALRGASAERRFLPCLAALFLWSGVVTAYAFYSLSMFTQHIKAELARKTFVDEITQVLNFRYLDRRLAQEHARVRRHGGSTSVLYIDLDHFKLVNDRYGHHLGNMVLQQIAEEMARQVRASDVVGRAGGDEFMVLLPHATREQAKVVADRLVKSVRDYRLILGDRGVVDFVRASVGVAAFPADGDSMETVVSAADAAVYEAKRCGGDMARLACESVLARADDAASA